MPESWLVRANVIPMPNGEDSYVFVTKDMVNDYHLPVFYSKEDADKFAVEFALKCPWMDGANRIEGVPWRT